MNIPKNSTLLFILFFVAIGSSLSAQKSIQNLPYEDLKPYHLGFLFGVHTQDLIVHHSGVVDENGDRWYGSVNQYEPGFSVGVIADLRLADNWSLRGTPTIHFGSKTLTLFSDVPTTTPVTANVRSNYCLIPINIRYRGIRVDNYRPYLTSGFSLGLDMGRDKMQPVLLQPMNVFWEFGVGTDIYMPDFKLVPELKVCFGLSDILVKNRRDQTNDAFVKYAEAFSSITSRLIVFSIQFE